MATIKTSEGANSVTHKNLATAVIAVMKDVKGMEKNSRVGTGNSAYDGTKDSDVKEVFNEVMARHGLVILPTDIIETTQIDRWEEESNWNGQKSIKMKQNVFTKVTTKYVLIHAESNEREILSGYGHGVDPQDKGAGKATTYALKNTLLSAFLTPVGKIDDTDNTHSKDITVPGQQPATAPAPEKKPAAKKPASLEARVKKTVEGINAITDGKKFKETYAKLPEDVKKDAKVIAALTAKKAEFTKKPAA